MEIEMEKEDEMQCARSNVSGQRLSALCGHSTYERQTMSLYFFFIFYHYKNGIKLFLGIIFGSTMIEKRFYFIPRYSFYTFA